MVRRATDGGRRRRVTDEEILDVFAETDDPVLSTAEVADRLPIQRRGTLNRLRGLQDEGVLDSKPIGGRNTVWWSVEDADEETVDETPPTPRATGEPRTAAAPVEAEHDAVDDENEESDLLDGIDYPGRGAEQRAARAEAIRRAYDLIREHGVIESRELQETIWEEFKDERIGYSASTSKRGPGWTLWDSCVRGALKQLPDVVSPPERGSEWRFEETD